MYDLTGEVFKSIHLIADQKIESLRLDKTVQVTIVSQSQNNQYRVIYQGVEYDAFALTDQTFTAGQSVLMLIPENNFSNKKLILGTTSKLSQDLSPAIPTFDSLAAITGSATTPSISFINDSDTGFYNFGTNQIGATLSGSVTYYFTPNRFFGQATDTAGIRISSPSTVSLADDASLSISLGVAGALIVSAYDQGAGIGAIWFCNYIENAIKLAPATGSTAATDTDGNLCVFKSTNSHTITLRNRLGSTKNISIGIFGASTN